MSKSLGNYIGIDEPPGEIFGKIMSISDELMWRYYVLLSAQPPWEIDELIRSVKIDGQNPRDYKIQLAKELIERFYSRHDADEAEHQFIQTFSERD